VEASTCSKLQQRPCIGEHSWRPLDMGIWQSQRIRHERHGTLHPPRARNDIIFLHALGLSHCRNRFLDPLQWVWFCCRC
jgi:hypothetical protein